MSAVHGKVDGGFSGKARALTVAINYIPFAQAACLVAIGIFLPAALSAKAVCLAAWLYLAPPVLFRILNLAAPVRETRHAVGSTGFFIWWTGHQLQVLFCRLGFLEELLRLVPGLYSLWLRLWGSSVGARTYWTAGVTVTDRAYLRVGDNVTFGAGVRLNAHVIAENAEGRPELILAPVTIGSGALVGGYSLLTAGTVVEAGTRTRAMLASPPFSRWNDRGRRKGTDAL